MHNHGLMDGNIGVWDSATSTPSTSSTTTAISTTRMQHRRRPIRPPASDGSTVPTDVGHAVHGSWKVGWQRSPQRPHPRPSPLRGTVHSPQRHHPPQPSLFGPAGHSSSCTGRDGSHPTLPGKMMTASSMHWHSLLYRLFP